MRRNAATIGYVTQAAAEGLRRKFGPQVEIRMDPPVD